MRRLSRTGLSLQCTSLPVPPPIARVAISANIVIVDIRIRGLFRDGRSRQRGGTSRRRGGSLLYAVASRRRPRHHVVVGFQVVVSAGRQTHTAIGGNFDLSLGRGDGERHRGKVWILLQYEGISEISQQGSKSMPGCILSRGCQSQYWRKQQR